MFLKSAFASAAFALVVFTACSESDQQTAAYNLAAAGDGSVDAPVESGGSTGTGGAATGGRTAASGGTRAQTGGRSSTRSDAGPASDATPNDATSDAPGNAPEVGPPVCMPNGIRSWCIRSSDCCSSSCILNQCTCVPLGYSCSGPGQCCSGYACVNGTCICPPDIRGC